MRKALLALLAGLFVSQAASAETFEKSAVGIMLDANGQQHGLGFTPTEGPVFGAVHWSPKPRLNLPEEFDARTLGQVAPVRDQGPCGSCWAFAITKSHESARLRAGQPALDLSEQDQVSCDTTAYKCNGGFMSNHDWAVKHGSPLEADYKYTATSSRCKSPEPAIAAKATRWAYCGKPGKQPTMAEIKQCLVDYGVLSVVVAAGGTDWSKGGNMNGCNVRGQNHMVNLIGYGKKADRAGSLVEKLFGRNSWGPAWGDHGDFYAVQGCDELASGPESVAFVYVEGDGPAPAIPQVKLPESMNVHPDTEIALGRRTAEAGVTYKWFADGAALGTEACATAECSLVYVTPAKTTVYSVKATTANGTAESAVKVTLLSSVED